MLQFSWSMIKKEWITGNRARWLFVLLAIILSFLILFISLVKASVPALANEEGGFSVEPIKYQILGDDGTLKDLVYELPYPGILPPHPLFVFKRIRDWMWLRMTRDHYKKAMLLHRFADREMGAAVVMSENDRSKTGLEFAEKAIEDLEEAYEETKKEKVVYIEAKQIGVQIREAGIAYEYAIWDFKPAFFLDEGKWDIILRRIRDFNLQDGQEE